MSGAVGRLGGWRRRSVREPLVFFLLCLASAHILGQGQSGLVYLVEQALATEPSLMSATAELQAAEARYDQSRGGLLPQIRASANTGYNGRDYTTRPRSEDPWAGDPDTEDGQKAPSRSRAETERGRYNASGGEISLTLPVFRPALVIEKDNPPPWSSRPRVSWRRPGKS